MPPDWETELRRAWRNNFNSFRLDETRTKIADFCRMHGITEEEMLAALDREPLMRWIFVKDPKKQNIYERIAADYIRGMQGVKDFERLGTSQLLLVGGMVMEADQVRKKGGDPRSKTIDFKWSFNGRMVYASHKYTLEAGGAQDHQYRDLLDFMEEARRSTSMDNVFIAIADGPYYDTVDSRLNCKRIDCLRSRGKNKQVFAGRIDDVPEILGQL